MLLISMIYVEAFKDIWIEFVFHAAASVQDKHPSLKQRHEKL